jgi:hypothetical protein
MTKKYKISSIIYSFILVFAILFMLMLLFASGHKITFDLWDYSIPILALLNLMLLYVFPKISNEKRNAKTIFRVLLMLFLITGLYLSIRTIIEIWSGNLIPGFIVFAFTINAIFITSIIFLVIEILKKANNNP